MPGLSLVLKVLANAKLPDALRLSGLVLSLQCREKVSLPAVRMPYRAFGIYLGPATAGLIFS
ncbi:hypothetical protein LXJ56_09940, partial [Escherichia coli]|nr:hypothetical protein [Escherichia coli]